MPLFRKKPVLVQAMRYDGHNGPEIKAWSQGKVVPSTVLEPSPDNPEGSYHIHTREGTMTAIPGTWIVQGVHGEFYPVQHDIFMATYEPEDTLDLMARVALQNGSALDDTPETTKRRLLGWRVRWEEYHLLALTWVEEYTDLLALPAAHNYIRSRSDPTRFRNVRLYRVYQKRTKK